MSLNPYLTFNGNCREAFDFYRSVFGGEFGLVSTFRDGPDDMGIPAEERDRIMHISLPIGSSFLLGSDTSASMSPPVATGANFAISFDAQDRQQADRVFAGLAADGKVIMPMGDMFWGAYFGIVVDQFGFQWQVIAEHG